MIQVEALKKLSLRQDQSPDLHKYPHGPIRVFCISRCVPVDDLVLLEGELLEELALRHDVAHVAAVHALHCVLHVERRQEDRRRPGEA